ncbi:carbamoyltransferase HypF [Spirulina sp. CS-785/01]|uniref:carbamoyltransferase HypF n=1 Tax=Spirulina sp. CS-785/01 TaxID=3021716 RepID=UPI00232EFEE8|nr:carbamoyltransferase HypF [Spirulina sp. CS-785/01]MDB9314569.1 carbamoyltransferase HypF [Spirulina sp. CS-785/01]
MPRLSIKIRGIVQGVGFRPFIYNLATELNLTGWVNNSSQGVFIEAEGEQTTLDTFITRIQQENPPHSRIQTLETHWLSPVGYETFNIRESTTGEKTTLVLPDLATCSDCLAELFAPNNRRYHYPFINCTHCGPRYSIIKALPYDRPQTTMAHFTLCEQCQQEYENPRNRRFHAQPNACKQCGPQLQFWETTGEVTETQYGALLKTVAELREGKILAVKGLGGFHLMVMAENEEAVKQLRQRKQRPDKPFAVMYPSLEAVKADCLVSEGEAALLESAEAPIVLLRKQRDIPGVAPQNPNLGVMLPYTPLHHLLMAELAVPVVATSGNFTNEPICIEEQEALTRLQGIADGFLVHNRPIVRPVDDSIVRVMGGKPALMRRARGYAPLPLSGANNGQSEAILAVGAHLKNTVAFATPASPDSRIFLSQHIGDLETPQAFAAFEETIESFGQLYELHPEVIACDAHPDYLSTQYAKQLGGKIIPVQHHLAHVYGSLGEHHLLDKTVLGVAWDGTGYGLDGTVWGGEFLRVSGASWERVAHLRRFPLVGGDRASKEPRRSALGLLYARFGEELWEKAALQPFLNPFTPQELSLLRQSLQRNINTVLTSSVGRAFDGIASLLNLCQRSSFEGQAAMALEFVIEGGVVDRYPVEITETTPLEIDWNPWLAGILGDIAQGIPSGVIAAKFHNSLIDSIAAIAQKIEIDTLILTGGCFQNQYLTETTIQTLKQQGITPYWNTQTPPNDGSIALGQAIYAQLKS